MNWGYDGALEAAGAEILAFKSFGTYQGNWYAKVRHEGETFWVAGYYGSCSGCDALEGEYNLDYSVLTADSYEDCMRTFATEAEYEQERAEQLKLYADFGRTYLTDRQDEDDIEQDLRDSISWDVDAQEALAWFLTHRTPKPEPEPDRQVIIIEAALPF